MKKNNPLCSNKTPNLKKECAPVRATKFELDLVTMQIWAVYPNGNKVLMKITEKDIFGLIQRSSVDNLT
jgi:hypothetical protein